MFDLARAFDHLLTQLGPAELHRVAAWLQASARAVRQRARQVERYGRIERRARRQVAALLPSILAALNEGMAAGDVAAQLDVPPATVEHYAARAALQRQERERAWRDRRLMQLARRGYSNAEIASDLARHGMKLHPSTVSRLLRQQLTAAGASAASPTP